MDQANFSQDSPLDPLPAETYRPSAQLVAPRLLGHYLLRRDGAMLTGGIIVETEAYLTGDPACHAFRGRTPRTEVMWGPFGRAYVYLIYGFYNCVNAVCSPSGVAEAVLIRAIEPSIGTEQMCQERGSERLLDLASGPGKLCTALKIDRTLNGVNLYEGNSPLVIAKNHGRAAYLRKYGPIALTPRIGINLAADLPLRFCLSKSPFLSRKIRTVVRD